MRLATKLMGLALSCALLVTGAETALAETPEPSPEPSISATTEPSTPPTTEPTSAATEVTPAAPSASTTSGVQPAEVPASTATYRNPYCADPSTLLSAAAKKKAGLSADYFGSPVALGQRPDVIGFVPKEGAKFNNPFTSSSTVVIRQLLNGVRAAAAGSTVKIAMYSMSRWDSAKAVIRAHCRGVNIQYLTDDHAVTTGPTQATKRVLTWAPPAAPASTPSVVVANPNAGSQFKACYLSCSSDYKWKGARVRVATTANPVYRPYMHAKYLTFDTLGGVPYVTMTSSGNFTVTQVKHGWNNVYTSVRDQSTYNFLNDRLAEMWKDTSGNDYAVNSSTAGPDKKVYFFPWAVANPKSSLQTVNPDTDPYTSFLENVKCTGASKGYGNSKRRTQVFVSMYQWTSSRLYLARRLKRLKNAGCDVKVLMSASEWDLEVMPILRKWDKKKLKTTYKYGNILIRNGDRGSRFIHSKFILVNGKWGNNSKTKVVFTGSGNWTKSSLRFNNEVNLLITGVGYGQFKDNWNKMWNSRKYSTPITKLAKKKTSRGDA